MVQLIHDLKPRTKDKERNRLRGSGAFDDNVDLRSLHTRPMWSKAASYHLSALAVVSRDKDWELVPGVEASPAAPQP